jgi:ATP-binding cassette subfamily F protein uup
MALISIQDVSLVLGGQRMFDNISLQVDAGERVALLGRNGVGKTTLMKVVAHQMRVDSGEISYQKGTRVTHLLQEVPVDLTGTIFDIVLSGLPDRVKLLSDLHHLHQRLQTEDTPQLMAQLDRLHAEMDRTHGWETQRQIEDVVSHTQVDPDSRFEQLSGGEKRKVLLAKALVLKPDVLLLDEPTNHLDIRSIEWLEGFLKDYPGTIVFVTHDRLFMTRLATKIVELDRGKLYSWTCDYPTFLERKAALLDAEAARWEQFDKKLAQEEVWIRQGIRARRTRNEGRVRALERLREEKKTQRQILGKVRMTAQEAARSGQVVTTAEHITLSFGEQCIIKDFSVRIMRGDKIGVVGPNGCGKTTLLRVLLGTLPPQSGTVTVGTNLAVAYYDQLREQLDEEQSVAENVCSTGDTVVVNGKPRHIIGYLEDFLFSPDRARTKIKQLSGGERNRVLLARLFTKTSNVLIMDEPTNDLDVETLELLEELLIGYSGTLILVSHDRAFLNNIVTSTIVLEGNGVIYEYPGGYDDWLNRPQSRVEEPEPPAAKKATRKIEPAAQPPKPKKLTLKEQKELDGLHVSIERLDAEHAQLIERMASPDFYQKASSNITDITSRLAAITAELARLYDRWEYLEQRRSQAS